jgi:hypothetical protein
VGHAEGCAFLTAPARLEVKTKTSKFALRISRFLIFFFFPAAAAAY